MTRLPRPAGWLLRLAPVPRDSRADVEADLLELFAERRSQRGAVHAHWRLYHDMASLWRRRPSVTAANSRSPFALLLDARADLRYAVRLFARQPAILLLTIVGLSLGLGIATSAFSIMNAAALRGEGLVDAGRLPGVLKTTARSQSTTWAYDEFLRLRDGATRMQVEAVLTDIAAARVTTGEAEAPSVPVAFVSGGFFAATGGRAARGRALETGDETHAGPPPVVVSHGFWTSRLNRDPLSVGRTIWIGRTQATIVGVAAEGFSAPRARMVWAPLTAYGAVYDATPVKRTPESGIEVFGRLSPGATLSAAEAQLSGVASALPGGGAGDPVQVRLDLDAGLGRAAATDVLATTLFVFAVIALVLVLACANVATVLIATAITRQREMGVRAALGASRGRIVRQLVTESLALGTVAAGIGLVFTYWALPVIGTMIEAPAGSDFNPDLTVFVFLGIVTVLTGLGAGLAPARHGRGADLVSPLKGDSARHDRLAPRRLRSLLVMTQAAVSVLLIVMATLFVRATFHAATIDVGFESAGLYAVSPGYGRAFEGNGAGMKDYWPRAIAELRPVPGVAALSMAELTPFDGLRKSATTSEQPARIVRFNRTGAEFFDAMGLRLHAGRTFTPQEVAGRAPVAVVSQSLARAYWPDRSPLGELLPAAIPIPAIPAATTRPTVVGVVDDAIVADLHERNVFAVYEPLDPASLGAAQLMVRIAPGATGAIDQARQRLRAIDDQADISIASVGARVEQEANRPRMLAILSGVVGLIAIVLCVIGLYGLTASVVGQRSREMGIRTALGADASALLRLLMWDSLRPVVIGLVVGAATALLISRVAVSAMLFGVSPQDPLAFGGAAAILLVSAMLAVLVPTRRAAAVDAATVLRQ